MQVLVFAIRIYFAVWFIVALIFVSIDISTEKLLAFIGKWDMRRAAFFKGVPINRWGLLICADYRKCSESLVESFCRQLSAQSRQLQMPIEERPGYVKYHTARSSLLSSFDEIINNTPGIQILVVVLDGALYGNMLLCYFVMYLAYN